MFSRPAKDTATKKASTATLFPKASLTSLAFSPLTARTGLLNTPKIDKIEFYSAGKPIQGGLYDPAMGNVGAIQTCTTCPENTPVRKCSGHPGHIELPVEIFNPLFKLSKELIMVCKLTCHRCGNLPFWNKVFDSVAGAVVASVFPSGLRNDGTVDVDPVVVIKIVQAAIVQHAEERMLAESCSPKVIELTKQLLSREKTVAELERVAHGLVKAERAAKAAAKLEAKLSKQGVPRASVKRRRQRVESQRAKEKTKSKAKAKARAKAKAARAKGMFASASASALSDVDNSGEEDTRHQIRQTKRARVIDDSDSDSDSNTHGASGVGVSAGCPAVEVPLQAQRPMDATVAHVNPSPDADSDAESSSTDPSSSSTDPSSSSTDPSSTSTGSSSSSEGEVEVEVEVESDSDPEHDPDFSTALKIAKSHFKTYDKLLAKATRVFGVIHWQPHRSAAERRMHAVQESLKLLQTCKFCEYCSTEEVRTPIAKYSLNKTNTRLCAEFRAADAPLLAHFDSMTQYTASDIRTYIEPETLRQRWLSVSEIHQLLLTWREEELNALAGSRARSGEFEDPLRTYETASFGLKKRPVWLSPVIRDHYGEAYNANAVPSDKDESLYMLMAMGIEHYKARSMGMLSEIDLRINPFAPGRTFADFTINAIPVMPPCSRPGFNGTGNKQQHHNFTNAYCSILRMCATISKTLEELQTLPSSSVIERKQLINQFERIVYDTPARAGQRMGGRPGRSSGNAMGLIQTIDSISSRPSALTAGAASNSGMDSGSVHMLANSISEIVNGKGGLVNHLVGKRGSNRGRNVMVANPMYHPCVIGVPASLSTVLTTRVPVNDINMSKVQDWYASGIGLDKDIHHGPGIVTVEWPDMVAPQFTAAAMASKLRKAQVTLPSEEAIAVKTSSEYAAISKCITAFEKGELLRVRLESRSGVQNLQENRPMQTHAIVNRQLQDGDVIFANRPPTLHINNFALLTIKVEEKKYAATTSLSVLSAYAGDNDGDCLQLTKLNDPQSEGEARELYTLPRLAMNTGSGANMYNVVLSASTAANQCTVVGLVFDRYIVNHVMGVLVQERESDEHLGVSAATTTKTVIDSRQISPNGIPLAKDPWSITYWADHAAGRVRTLGENVPAKASDLMPRPTSAQSIAGAMVNAWRTSKSHWDMFVKRYIRTVCPSQTGSHATVAVAATMETMLQFPIRLTVGRAAVLRHLQQSAQWLIGFVAKWETTFEGSKWEFLPSNWPRKYPWAPNVQPIQPDNLCSEVMDTVEQHLLHLEHVWDTLLTVFRDVYPGHQFPITRPQAMRPYGYTDAQRDAFAMDAVWRCWEKVDEIIVNARKRGGTAADGLSVVRRTLGKHTPGDAILLKCIEFMLWANTALHERMFNGSAPLRQFKQQDLLSGTPFADERWTGHAVFTAMLRPPLRNALVYPLTVEYQSGCITSLTMSNEFTVMNGVALFGSIKKGDVEVSASSLQSVIAKMFSNAHSLDFIADVTRMATVLSMVVNHTMNIRDFEDLARSTRPDVIDMPHPKVVRELVYQESVRRGYVASELELTAKMRAASIEGNVKASKLVGQAIAALPMTHCLSAAFNGKGNAAQIKAQLWFGGIANELPMSPFAQSLSGRPTPHTSFYSEDHVAADGAMVLNPLLLGLDNRENMFHARSGRVSMTLTQNQVPKSGKSQKDCCNKLQSCISDYNGVVMHRAGYRERDDQVVSFFCGGHGCNGGQITVVTFPAEPMVSTEFGVDANGHRSVGTLHKHADAPNAAAEARLAIVAHAWLAMNTSTDQFHGAESSAGVAAPTSLRLPVNIMSQFRALSVEAKLRFPAKATATVPTTIAEWEEYRDMFAPVLHQACREFTTLLFNDNLQELTVLNYEDRHKGTATPSGVPTFRELHALRVCGTVACYLLAHFTARVAAEKYGLLTRKQVAYVLTSLFAAVVLQSIVPKGESIGIAASTTLNEMVTQMLLKEFSNAGVKELNPAMYDLMRIIIFLSRPEPGAETVKRAESCKMTFKLPDGVLCDASEQDNTEPVLARLRRALNCVTVRSVVLEAFPVTVRMTYATGEIRAKLGEDAQVPDGDECPLWFQRLLECNLGAGRARKAQICLAKTLWREASNRVSTDMAKRVSDGLHRFTPQLNVETTCIAFKTTTARLKSGGYFDGVDNDGDSVGKTLEMVMSTVTRCPTIAVAISTPVTSTSTHRWYPDNHTVVVVCFVDSHNPFPAGHEWYEESSARPGGEADHLNDGDDGDDADAEGEGDSRGKAKPRARKHNSKLIRDAEALETRLKAAEETKGDADDDARAQPSWDSSSALEPANADDPYAPLTSSFGKRDGFQASAGSKSSAVHGNVTARKRMMPQPDQWIQSCMEFVLSGVLYVKDVVANEVPHSFSTTGSNLKGLRTVLGYAFDCGLGVTRPIGVFHDQKSRTLRSIPVHKVRTTNTYEVQNLCGVEGAIACAIEQMMEAFPTVDPIYARLFLDFMTRRGYLRPLSAEDDADELGASVIQRAMHSGATRTLAAAGSIGAIEPARVPYVEIAIGKSALHGTGSVTLVPDMATVNKYQTSNKLAVQPSIQTFTGKKDFDVDVTPMVHTPTPFASGLNGAAGLQRTPDLAAQFSPLYDAGDDSGDRTPELTTPTLYSPAGEQWSAEVYQPASPRYNVASPVYGHGNYTSPRYDPRSPLYSPGFPTGNPGVTSPAYNPASPVYGAGRQRRVNDFTSPAYNPTSPTYNFTSPAYNPSSPTYFPTSPRFAPHSPLFSPGNASGPTSPSYSRNAAVTDGHELPNNMRTQKGRTEYLTRPETHAKSSSSKESFFD